MHLQQVLTIALHTKCCWTVDSHNQLRTETVTPTPSLHTHVCCLLTRHECTAEPTCCHPQSWGHVCWKLDAADSRQPRQSSAYDC